MTDRGSDRPNDPMQAMMAQFRAMAEQFAALSTGRIPSGGSTPSGSGRGPARSDDGDAPMPTGLRGVPPLPGALTAAQLRSVSSAIASQRSQIHSMRTQLEAFDQQLEVLESIVAPLVRWSQTWATTEQLFAPGLGRARADDDDPAPDGPDPVIPSDDPPDRPPAGEGDKDGGAGR
ncbi:MAG: hypothetical protein ACK5RL_07935 [Acidimicrobiales bacterium]